MAPGGRGRPQKDLCIDAVIWLFIYILLEMVAFVTGIMAWKDVFGKITVITIPIITVLFLLFCA